MSAEPFMEHPTGDFTRAIDAIQDAIERLAKCIQQDKWITFSGQGQGIRSESYYIVDFTVRGRSINIGECNIDLNQVLSYAVLNGKELGVTYDKGIIEVPLASSRQFAKFIDALFYQLGVRPFDGEDDYAVGAEW